MQLKQIILGSMLVFFISQHSIGQVVNTGLMDTASGEKVGNLSVGAYVDVYYGYSTSATKQSEVPYMISMNRHNEATINLAYIDLRYQSENFRTRLVPGFGAYMNSNYQEEEGSLRNIVEATIGYQLDAKRKIWVDAGVLGSPYTNESVVSKDHLLYTRSFAPEYVPYYLSGIKLSMPVKEKWMLYLYLLNGWQQIQDRNNSKSLGTQIEYRPNNNSLFNFNTYVGNEQSERFPEYRIRYFCDFYWIYQANQSWEIISCAYAGYQQLKDRYTFSDQNLWWQLNFSSKHRLSNRWSLSYRMEYFSDHNKLIVPVQNRALAFECFSSSIGLNQKLSKNILYRLEGRGFYSEQDLFTKADKGSSNTHFWLITSLTSWF
jgi:hypothetical protein